MHSKIAQVVVGLPIEGPFDYSVDEKMSPVIAEGMRVYVPFHHRKVVGYVVGFIKKSAFANLKPVLSCLENTPTLDPNALRFTKRFADYYGCAWGEAIETILPAALHRRKILEWPTEPKFDSTKEKVLKPSGSKPENRLILCQDKGTEKRWALIAARINETLARGEGVIILVPEKHMIEKVRGVLQKQCVEPFVVMDKALSSAKILEAWQKIRQGFSRVVIGTRSTVFAPVRRLGLMVVYDEDSSAYKQEQSPFYHVRDVALFRSEIEGNKVLFVSSVPSTELWWMMREREGESFVFEPDQLANLQFLDLSNYKSRRRATISYPLSTLIEQTLAQGGKVALFLNRIGFSTVSRCEKCQETVKCPRCEVNVAYLYAKKKLVCHLCNALYDLPSECPKCHTAYLRYWGVGIEKMQSELARIFPQARVARFDRETKSLPARTDIVIGTQAVLKVLEQFQPTLAAVLDVDTELGRVDFRAPQRVFSLLIHLRQLAKEKVVVQTFDPGHYCLQCAAQMDFEKFYREESHFRKEAELPPFSHLVAVGLRGPKKEMVFNQAKEIYEKLQAGKPDGSEVLDPQPDIVAKLRDKYRFTIMLKGQSLPTLLENLKAVVKSSKRKQGVILTINVDP